MIIIKLTKAYLCNYQNCNMHSTLNMCVLEDIKRKILNSEVFNSESLFNQSLEMQ